jgi:hypothetical protein
VVEVVMEVAEPTVVVEAEKNIAFAEWVVAEVVVAMAPCHLLEVDMVSTCRKPRISTLDPVVILMW